MMSDASGPKTSHGGAGRSLKEQNRWQLWVIVAVNSLFLYGVVQANAIKSSGISAAFSGGATLIPIALALVIATVLNGVIGADTKARLVFLRWRHALPGHRAFTDYGEHDPRVDVPALNELYGPLPVDPLEQNRLWYRLYKMVENDPAVVQVHRDFLLLRDYTALSALFVVFLGTAGLFAIPSLKVALTYLALLGAQYALVRQSASNYGVRMVTTVLARRPLKEDDNSRSPLKQTPSGGPTRPTRNRR